MGVSVVDTITGFNTALQKSLYIGSKTAVLKPSEKKFSPEFGEIKIRQISITGGAGNYSKSAGFDGAGGNAVVSWKTYTADNDRYFNLSVDATDELSSYLRGTKPSILAGFELFVNQKIAAEADAVAMARAYSASIDGGNTLLESTLSKDFFGGLIDIQQMMFNKGVDSNKTVYAFIEASVYAQGEKEIINKYGLASDAVLTKYKMEIPTGIMGEDNLEVTVDSIKFNNMILIKMPEERMGTTVTLLDGRTSGQTSGGFIAGDTKMSAVFVPEGTMFVDVRYEIFNMLFPAPAYTYSSQADIDAAVKKILGDVKIENVGINQRSNSFNIDARVIYDAKAIDINKDKILVFKEKAVSGS